ncbi:MAG: hypothetical protein NXH78_13520 [Hyphomonadaceae bacterium]|nr:hypothetical protein [Hyphomonadaceae bacterium]
MPTPRTAALLIASSAILFAPGAFADAPETHDVVIEVDLDAAPEVRYESVRQQAWMACKPELGSTYISSRTRLRRDCQKQVVAYVMKQLAQMGAVRFAETKAVDAQ